MAGCGACRRCRAWCRRRGGPGPVGAAVPKPPQRRMGPSRLWGSGSQSQAGDGAGFSFGLEQLAESGAELAVDDGAADLEQEIGTAAGPAHLLLLVHAPVDQEVGGAFGDRGADPLAGAMPLGMVDQPGALAGQVAVDLAQCGPEPAR